MNRLVAVHRQIQIKKEEDRFQWFKSQGWGYKDTEFVLGDDGVCTFQGTIYDNSGTRLPKLREWGEQTIGLVPSEKFNKQAIIQCDSPKNNQQFIEEIKGVIDEFTQNDDQRIYHSHGHTMQDMYCLRYSKFERVVDGVIYVKNHEQCQNLVKLALKHNVVLIPFGGGTNVTLSLLPQKEEQRMIISVDMMRMNTILWIDKVNMKACVQAGVVGKNLESELKKYGVMMGHEPDSIEFSTLGGWISTRASGMKKNRYGNIDDIIQSVKIVTPIGTFVKMQDVPRISSGPDINEFILGSEGNFGIITEAIIKLRNLPEKIVYDSIIFHDYDIGIQFMYDVSLSKIWPASIRTVDNEQFKFGMALKPENNSKFHEYIDKAKKYFITQIKHFDPDSMCLTTICYEGSQQEIALQQSKIKQLMKKHQGFRAGAENGQRGYLLTFMIAYLRDFGLDYGFFAESFETSVPWKNVSVLVKNVKNKIENDCKSKGIKLKPFFSSRVTQLYDTGACVYIYFGFTQKGLSNPMKIYEEIEDNARVEVMQNGGSISHHHGVGKLRKKFLEQSIGQLGVDLIKTLKEKIDPTNIFATGNLI